MMMYLGASGAAWGLQRSGVQLQIEPALILQECLRQCIKDNNSYFFGETGIRLALQAILPSTGNLEKLNHCLISLKESTTNEIMAGAPGALIATQLLWELTRNDSYKSEIRQLLTGTLEKWKMDESSGLPLWTQNYGGPAIYLGAAHGAVGNIVALLRSSFLTDEERKTVQNRAILLLKKTALQNENEANWPSTLPIGNKDLLVHWCHGAPGILMSLATLLPIGEDPEFDQLMIKAGNLVWHAGGLKKGASLCHGTAGSGAALLKLYERTGDELWLSRARSFAMATIGQIEALRDLYKSYRYSLWTGDIGSALFLQSCKTGRFLVPMIEAI